MDAPFAASAALCRHICYPRLALKCAALREGLAFMGHCSAEGDEVRRGRGRGVACWMGTSLTAKPASAQLRKPRELAMYACVI